METPGFLYVIIVLECLAILTAIVFLYRFFYKRHLNKKLNGEPSRFTLIDPFNFILVVLMIVIIVIGVVGNGKLNDLEDTVSDLRSQNSYLQHKLNNVNSNINSVEQQFKQFKEQMIQDAKWIQNSSYKFIDQTEDESRVVTKINFDFKELDTNQTIYLLISNKADESDVQRVEVIPEDFKYEATVELEWSNNYKLEVVGETNSVVKKEALFDIDVADKFNNETIIYYIEGVIDPENKDYDDLFLGLKYYHGGIESLKVDRVMLITTKDGNKTETDITETIKVNDTPTYYGAKVIFSEIGIEPDQFNSFEVIIIDRMGNEYISGEYTDTEDFGK
ncbi:hypothetical protein [Haloplasma contractile]|uniref:Uncharacterized protein n=1 Tax=Haloplasma contractile SSD-17B TaxID=1033810 RepID=F7Q2G3_9MOLU|nr:hypothetical protein [Haloplasma contractile]ERJ11974.1 hypothetical protein HLPCO_001888 [Haloplasma contractile SSD-17B]